MKRRVVITGLGALTAHGEGPEPLWQAALEGRSSTHVTDFDPEKYITQAKAIKVMARDIQMAVAGASLALKDAALSDLSNVDRTRIGVIVGSGILNHELDELACSITASLGSDNKIDMQKFGESGIFSLFPLWLLKYLPNMPACQISILFDLEGPNNSLTTGASSGLAAVAEAFRILERGAADLMLAGGSESKLNPVGLSHYSILGVLSDVYRPLDARASGFVVGEGSGFLLLEELEHAKRRGARVYAEIAGFGSSSQTGLPVAMRSALAESGISAEKIGLIIASGIGLPQEDLKELAAIETVFPDHSALSITAQKPLTGFTGFSSGALDLILAVLSLKNGFVPATQNFGRSKNGLSAQIVKSKPLKKKIDYAMTNASGLGAPSVSTVVGRYDG